MSESQDKLSWLAFRYVSNELGASEVDAFESLLLTDQVAREAVASAVEETARIRQALAVVVTVGSQRSNWNRQTTRFAIVAVGSCATLLLALCLVRSSLPIHDRDSDHVVATDLSDSPAQLAYAWAEARQGFTELQPTVNGVLSDSLDGALIAAFDSESEASLVAPSWMLAALAKMDRGIDSEFEIQE